MMDRKKISLLISVIALIAIVAFMAYDFFEKEQANKNPYEYSLSDWQHVEENQISHNELQQIELDIEMPRAIALDKNDRIFVGGNNKLLIHSKDGRFLKQVETDIQAFDLFISEEGLLYLSSRTKILVFDLNGRIQDTIVPQIEKLLLTSIVVNDQYMYLADAGNKIIHQCDLQGHFIKEIGAKDQEKGILGFVIPSPYFNLEIGRNGNLWAANTGRHRLESYDENGRLIYAWNKSSMGLDGFSGCCNPSHFAFLSNGNFVTSEKGIERIKIHSPNGDFLSVVAPPMAFERGTKGIDLAVDSEDRILAVDSKKNLVRIFAPKE